ncbi:MAG: hypothetical protein ACC662_01185, partial [Planctomycetota bacterium]
MGNARRPLRRAVPRAFGSRALRVLVVLALLGSDGAGARPSVPEAVPLKEAVLEDPAVLPPSLGLPVEGRIPADLAPGTYAATEQRGALVVDTTGRGRRGGRRVRPGRPIVLQVGADRRARVPVLVWRAQEGWRAAPARMGRAQVGKKAFEVLALAFSEADGPGRGWMRYDGGAFRPLLPATRIQVPTGWLAPRVVRTPKGGLVLRPGFTPAAVEAEI